MQDVFQKGIMTLLNVPEEKTLGDPDIKTGVLQLQLHWFNMITTRGDIFTICTMCVVSHDIQRAQDNDCDCTKSE